MRQVLDYFLQPVLREEYISIYYRLKKWEDIKRRMYRVHKVTSNECRTIHCYSFDILSFIRFLLCLISLQKTFRLILWLQHLQFLRDSSVYSSTRRRKTMMEILKPAIAAYFILPYYYFITSSPSITYQNLNYLHRISNTYFFV